MFPQALWSCFVWCLLTSLPLVGATNITVDDTSPAWTYPGSSWGSISAQAPCPSCVSQPNLADAYSGTYHDCSENCTAQLSFTGIAVYIYTICPGPHAGGVYVGNFTFKLDGNASGHFVQPNSCTDYTYNYVVFSRTDLTPGLHTVEITNNPGGGAFSTSDLLIDYAIYNDGSLAPPSMPAPGTTQSSNTSSKSSFPVAAVVAPVAVVVVLAIGIGWWLYRRHLTRLALRDSVFSIPRQDVAPRPYMSNTSRTHVSDTTHQYTSNGSRPVMSDGVSDTNSPTLSTTVGLRSQASTEPLRPANAAFSIVSDGTVIPISTSGDDPQLEAALAVIASRAGSNPNMPNPQQQAFAPYGSRREKSSRTSPTDAAQPEFVPDVQGPPSYNDTVRR